MFGLFCAGRTGNAVSPDTPEDELRARVARLNEDEMRVFEYLSRYFSRRWIAETLFIGRAELEGIIRSLLCTLGVSSIRQMRSVYLRLHLFEGRKIIDAAEIDAYAETRADREILELQQSRDKTQKA